MVPDDFQKAWHSQAAQTRVTIAADLLLKEVQRSERNFRATIFRRDFREVVVGLIMLPLWFYWGHRYSLPWTWWLGVPAITWVILFIVVDRFHHRQRPTEPGEPLVESVRASLSQVEHQIWLLRNVFWWYLLPFTIAILAFFAQNAWSRHTGFWPVTLAVAPFLLFLLALYGFIYWLNQHAVRRDLEPRREELRALLATLEEETASDQATGHETADVHARDTIQNSDAFRQVLLVTVLCAVVVALMFLVDSFIPYSKLQALPSGRGTPQPFAQLNSNLRRDNKLVGLAATVTVDGEVVASAVDGERKTGSGVPLELGDSFHVGGIAKSITATMIARLIESGQLDWSTTVGESFPNVPIHDDWIPVTLEQLLTDTAGAPRNIPSDIKSKRPPLGPERTRARHDAVLSVLAQPPAYLPGKRNEYSNFGYVIAAAIAEQVTGKSWEELVKREVFEPLTLTSAGFGPPASPDNSLPQPRGHLPSRGDKIAMDDAADNTPIIGPAGCVHMSLADLTTFAAEHLRGERGEGKLLSRETYNRLHTPALDRYACGWILDEPTSEMPYAVYWHNGSNTLWYAYLAFVPERNLVVAVTANDGDTTNAEGAAWEILKSAVNADPSQAVP